MVLLRGELNAAVETKEINSFHRDGIEPTISNNQNFLKYPYIIYIYNIYFVKYQSLRTKTVSNIKHSKSHQRFYSKKNEYKKLVSYSTKRRYSQTFLAVRNIFLHVTKLKVTTISFVLSTIFLVSRYFSEKLHVE